MAHFHYSRDVEKGKGQEINLNKINSLLGVYIIFGRHCYRREGSASKETHSDRLNREEWRM